ncbi:ATP-binding protein [Rhodoplanes sp. TEM]|uniref:histidine kinase n=1 Tax=Rhodoplanes tepidamans TaxID=200616 RepID=A0ABT5J9C4_RHOTP|nr:MULTISPECIES: ATP-binding protein [Rhodoplanes]MDC7786209.1 ATP-binding protein [Rhodoplanes tepidamans]MDC7982420.1 ATP-binding protein [Rhodoplanes sp. TEM]MDQ0355008.1 two-component system phosphate regulon sensor histidine kinase PhoR [Rhodoplanes tepidamans]
MALANRQERFGRLRSLAAAATTELTRVRAVVTATAGGLGLAVLTGALPPLAAALLFAAVMLALTLDLRRAARARAAAAEESGRGTDAGDLAIDATLAGFPDPVIVLERGGLVRAFNRRAIEVAPALATARPLSFALRHPGVLDAVRRAAEEAGTVRTEMAQRVPTERWWEAVIAPVRLPPPPGQSAGERLLMVSFHDLTPLRRAEQMRADFIANASHELRTPLASLSGFIDTLQGPARADTAAREKFLGVMKAQASRMARLIDDLLSLSRIELKAHVRPETPVDLVLLLRQVVEGLQPLAGERGVTIAFEPPPGAVTVAGDRDELLRAFENLVENALKYGASGGRVDLALARESGPQGDEIAVAVKDYGPGIAPEHLPRLTERFYRADVADSRAQGGTGLGLALVKHIMQRHRGRLGIDSTLGAGATFTVRLPALPARPQEHDTARAAG